MNQLGIALVWCAVQVTVVCLVAAAVCIGFRRSPAMRSWTVLLDLTCAKLNCRRKIELMNYIGRVGAAAR